MEKVRFQETDVGSSQHKCTLFIFRHYCLCWSCADFPPCQLCAQTTGILFPKTNLNIKYDASLFPRLPDRRGAIWGRCWQFPSIWFFIHTSCLSMNAIHQARQIHPIHTWDQKLGMAFDQKAHPPACGGACFILISNKWHPGGLLCIHILCFPWRPAGTEVCFSLFGQLIWNGPSLSSVPSSSPPLQWQHSMILCGLLG